MIQTETTGWRFRFLSLFFDPPKKNRFTRPKSPPPTKIPGSYMKQIRKKQLCTAVAAAMGAGVSLSLVAMDAFAQQTAQTKERIEVTGSNIKRVDQEGPNPVTVIRREDLERSGANNLQEILSKMSSTVNSFNEGANAGNTFAPGTAAVNLRGL